MGVKDYLWCYGSCFGQVQFIIHFAFPEGGHLQECWSKKSLLWVVMCLGVVVLVLKYLLAHLKLIESFIFTDLKTALQLLPEG